jgi:ribosomal protein S18 acetylase RimI-like enzyme
MDDLTLREAFGDDVTAVAELHADSWRRNYRGIFSDEYLRTRVLDDRNGVWADRLLHHTDPQRYVLLAHAGSQLAGFICVYANEHPRLGSLIDNLHVAAAHQRRGVGRQLMRAAAQWLDKRFGDIAVYLDVLEGNRRAVSFYEALQGRRQGPFQTVAADGTTVSSYHMIWENPAALVAGCDP